MAVTKPKGVSHADFNNNPGNQKAFNPDGSLNDWGKSLKNRGFKFTQGSEGEKGLGYFAKFNTPEEGLKANQSWWSNVRDWSAYKGLTLNEALQKYSGAGVKGNDGKIQTGYTVESLGVKGLKGDKPLSDYSETELSAVFTHQMRHEDPVNFKNLISKGLVTKDDFEVRVLSDIEKRAANVVNDAKKLKELHDSTINVKTEVKDLDSFKEKIDNISKSFHNDLKNKRFEGDDDEARDEYFSRISKAFGWDKIDQLNPEQLGKARGEVEAFFNYTEGSSYGEKIGGDQAIDSLFEDMTEDAYYTSLRLEREVKIPPVGKAPLRVYNELKGNHITREMVTGSKYELKNGKEGYVYEFNFDESGLDNYLAAVAPEFRELLSTGENSYKEVEDYLSSKAERTYIRDQKPTKENFAEGQLISESNLDIFSQRQETSLLDLYNDESEKPNQETTEVGVSTEETESVDESLSDDVNVEDSVETNIEGAENEALEYDESFLEKAGGLSSLIGLATGAIGLGQALKNVDVPKDPKLGPAFQQRLEESKKLAQQGLTPAELAKAHKDLDSSYATGIDNIVRGSAGNRAQFLAGLGGLDVARQSALMDIAVADAQMQRENQATYDDLMLKNETYEAARESKYQDAIYQQKQATKAAGAGLAGASASMIADSMANRETDRYYKVKTQQMLKDMGYATDKDGKSGQKRFGYNEKGERADSFLLNRLRAEDNSTKVKSEEINKNIGQIINEEEKNRGIFGGLFGGLFKKKTGLINSIDEKFEY